MPNKDKDLVLYLPLDEIHNDGKVPDASGLGNHGAVKGNVTLVPDDIFGACANFGEGQSSYIEVPSSDSLQKLGDFTIEAWVYIAKAPPPQQAVVLIEQGFPGGDYYNVTYNDRSILLSGVSARTAVPALPLNTWFHLAGVFSGATVLLLIHDLQGSLLNQANERMTSHLFPGGFTPSSQSSLLLGFGGSGSNVVVPHVGKLANFRAYKRALTLAEIERDARADCMSLVAFRKSHPVDFRLYDDDEQAVLYIGDDAAGHNLHLELRNTSAQALQLSDGGNAAASEKNHHFALRFRPGTLSDGALKLLANPQERAKLLKPAEQWDLYFQPILPAANETASLYLLYKGAGLSFLPNEPRALTLQRMSAAPGSGARGTQVELIPRQLTAAGGDSTPVTGSRTQYVHVTNHRGRKNIPLHVGFVDGNSVLNGGYTSNPPLRLRLTNVLQKGDITLLNKSADVLPSTLIISFDSETGQGTKPWALVTSATAANVKVTVAAAANVKASAGGREIRPFGIEGETPEWPITFDTPTPLAAGQYLEIQIDNIVSTLPTGHANLYVRYQNIPGYWDGQFVCVVEKGPVAYDGGNVGIGTRPSAGKLEVAGNVVANNFSVAPENERRGALFLATANDFNHAIYNNNSQADGGEKWDGANWNTGDGLRVRVGGGDEKKIALAIDESGHVGVSGNLSLSANSTVTFPKGCRIVGLPTVAVKKDTAWFTRDSPENFRRDGSGKQELTFEFAAKVISAEAIVSSVHAAFHDNVDSSKVWEEGQEVKVRSINGKFVQVDVTVMRKYAMRAPTPPQTIQVEIVVIAVLEGA
jgi:hypothetical protein